MSTRGSVEKLLSTMASADAEKTAALFGEEVDFLCAGSEDRSASVSAFLVDGEEAVVMGRVSQRLRSNGAAFMTSFALHLTVSPEGLIVRYHVYEDSLTVAEAAGA